MITDFIEAVGEWINGIIGFVIDSFEGIVPVFYKEGPDGGFTIYGALLLFGLAVGFVSLAIGFIRRLIQK